MLRAPIEATYESDLVDEQSRILYPLEILTERESESALGHLFQFWRQRCDGDKPPLVHEFNPREVLPEFHLSWVSWLDVTSENPLNFVIHDHDGRQMFGNLSTMRLRDIPNAMHMTACTAEYNRSKLYRQPLYYDIDQDLDGISRNFTRLMVPVTDRKGRVTKIWYACRSVHHVHSNADGTMMQRISKTKGTGLRERQ